MPHRTQQNSADDPTYVRVRSTCAELCSAVCSSAHAGGADWYVGRLFQASGPGWRATQAAICARELKPSLVSMLATCRATVAWLITSSSAMVRLLRPREISPASSRSRGVSVDGTAAPPPAGLAVPREGTAAAGP